MVRIRASKSTAFDVNSMAETSTDALALHLNLHYHQVLKQEITPFIEKGVHPNLFEWGFSDYLRNREKQTFDVLAALIESWLLEHQVNSLEQRAEKEAVIKGRGGVIDGREKGITATPAERAEAKAKAKAKKKANKETSNDEKKKPANPKAVLPDVNALIATALASALKGKGKGKGKERQRRWKG